MRNRN